MTKYSKRNDAKLCSIARYIIIIIHYNYNNYNIIVSCIHAVL